LGPKRKIAAEFSSSDENSRQARRIQPRLDPADWQHFRKFNGWASGPAGATGGAVRLRRRLFDVAISFMWLRLFDVAAETTRPMRKEFEGPWRKPSEQGSASLWGFHFSGAAPTERFVRRYLKPRLRAAQQIEQKSFGHVLDRVPSARWGVARVLTFGDCPRETNLLRPPRMQPPSSASLTLALRNKKAAESLPGRPDRRSARGDVAVRKCHQSW